MLGIVYFDEDTLRTRIRSDLPWGVSGSGGALSARLGDSLQDVGVSFYDTLVDVFL